MKDSMIKLRDENNISKVEQEQKKQDERVRALQIEKRNVEE